MMQARAAMIQFNEIYKDQEMLEEFVNESKKHADELEADAEKLEKWVNTK